MWMIITIETILTDKHHVGFCINPKRVCIKFIHVRWSSSEWSAIKCFHQWCVVMKETNFFSIRSTQTIRMLSLRHSFHHPISFHDTVYCATMPWFKTPNTQFLEACVLEKRSENFKLITYEKATLRCFRERWNLTVAIDNVVKHFGNLGSIGEAHIANK